MADSRQVNVERRPSVWTALGALLATILVLSACKSAASQSIAFGSSAPLAQPSWPIPADPMTLATQAGLVSEQREYLVTHIHAHLDLFVDGKPVTIPAGIGIDIKAAGVRDEKTPDGTAHSYFVDTCQAPCLSPLHTHDPSGMIHEESRAPNHPPYSLGQFFTEWGLALDSSCVGKYCRPDALVHIYLDGTPFEGDPASIQLKSHLEVAIVIGQPPSLIPATYDFGDQP
jgi:hypothetical protein